MGRLETARMSHGSSVLFSSGYEDRMLSPHVTYAKNKKEENVCGIRQSVEGRGRTEVGVSFISVETYDVKVVRI